MFFPQIAIAIGVLTSNRGGRATNHFGGLDVAPGCHCRVQWTWCHCWVPSFGCHCNVLWLGRVTTKFGGVDVVPSLGAIVACFGGEAEGDDQLWGSGCGAIAGCHCRVPF